MRRRGLDPTHLHAACVVPTRRRRWWKGAPTDGVAGGVAGLVGLVVLAAVLVACGGGKSDDTGTDAAIYAEVLHRVVGEDTEPPPLVFVRPVSGHTIDLGVQAEVVRLLDQVAVVRFVDENDEVVLLDKPLKPVRDDAMVVTVSPIVRFGSRAEVVTDRYVDLLHREEQCVALRRVEDTWGRDADGCATPA